VRIRVITLLFVTVMALYFTEDAVAPFNGVNDAVARSKRFLCEAGQIKTNFESWFFMSSRTDLS
jgi:hypothetical protein